MPNTNDMPGPNAAGSNISHWAQSRPCAHKRMGFGGICHLERRQRERVCAFLRRARNTWYRRTKNWSTSRWTTLGGRSYGWRGPAYRLNSPIAICDGHRRHAWRARLGEVEETTRPLRGRTLWLINPLRVPEIRAGLCFAILGESVGDGYHGEHRPRAVV